MDIDLGSHFFSSNPEHLRACGSWWHACPTVLGLSKALQGGPQAPPVSSEEGAGECSLGGVGRETLAGERGGLCLGSQAGDGSSRRGRVEHRVAGGGGRRVILTWGGALTLIPGSWSVPASKSHGPPPLLRCVPDLSTWR